VKKVTTQVKIKQFTNETDKFDDLFQSMLNYSEVEREATGWLIPEELVQFHQYRVKRISHFPIEILNLNH